MFRLGRHLTIFVVAHTSGIPNVVFNSGAYRSDCVDYPSPWTRAELDAVLPFRDVVVVLKISGANLHKILENSVSQYPLYSGIFMQVSGVKFEFDPRKKPGSRIETESVSYTNRNGERIFISEDNSTFEIVTNSFMFQQYCLSEILSKENFVRDENHPAAEMVAQYLKSIETDIDKDGESELGSVSPKVEERIVCTFPDPDLLKLYPISN